MWVTSVTDGQTNFSIASDLEFSRLESWSRDPFLQVLVLVLGLEPQSLGVGTMETRSLSFMKREIQTVGLK